MVQKPRLTKRHRIAVDAMGGDHAPEEIVFGALDAATTFDVDILLVGQEARITAELTKHTGSIPANIEIVDAAEVVEMCDPPVTPLRRKRNSSIRIAANLVGEGRADAHSEDKPQYCWGAVWVTEESRKDLQLIGGNGTNPAPSYSA